MSSNNTAPMSATTSRGLGMRGEWPSTEVAITVSEPLASLRPSKLPGLCGNTRYLTVAFSFRARAHVKPILSESTAACGLVALPASSHVADVGKMVIRSFRTKRKFKTANNTKRLTSQLADNLAALSRLEQKILNNLKGLGYER